MKFQEIKEITDFTQFSKESLLPFGCILLKMTNEQISSDFLLGFKRSLLLVKNFNFSSQMLYRSVQMNRFQVIFLQTKPAKREPSTDFNEM